jgi:flagellar protein FlbD
MITLTRLDGNSVCVNEINVLWVEALPDTSVMLLGGTRILVRESVAEVKRLMDERSAIVVAHESPSQPMSSVP